MQNELDAAKQVADQAKAQAAEVAKKFASLSSDLEDVRAQRNELLTTIESDYAEVRSSQLPT